MLQPVLEIFVVWHPRDVAAKDVAEQVFEHFHGTVFSGLLGGAIEVYVRSQGWRCQDDAPRPLPFPEAIQTEDASTARLVCVVPVLDQEFAAAVEDSSGPWHAFARDIVEAQRAAPKRTGIFPLLLNPAACDGTELGRLFGRYQRIGAPSPQGIEEPAAEIRCRDLSQGIAQLAAASDTRLTVFISHTKRTSTEEEEDVPELIRLVRKIIGETRLRFFFDANDPQPGRDWDAELRAQAAKGALLALRTDLYASREWCQREMLLAKRNGMPIVILDSLGRGEERGSFLMDHLPRIPVREETGKWSEADIRRGLNLLVDECLKRTLWNIQKELGVARKELDVAWWAPHAPEPVTLTQWLEGYLADGTLLARPVLRILHPDPPLGPEEKGALDQILSLSGYRGQVEVMTPRTMAARGV